MNRLALPLISLLCLWQTQGACQAPPEMILVANLARLNPDVSPENLPLHPIPEGFLIASPCSSNSLSVTFTCPLPQLEPSEILLFHSELLLEDSKDRPSNLRFFLKLNGQKQDRWIPTPGEIKETTMELTSFAGQSVEITLVSESLSPQHPSSIQWNTPRIYRLPAPTPWQSSDLTGASKFNEIRIPFHRGAIALTYSSDSPIEFKLSTQPPTTTPLHWQSPVGSLTYFPQQWAFIPFDFPPDSEVRLTFPADLSPLPPLSISSAPPTSLP